MVESIPTPSSWMVLPFVMLLAMIALGPLFFAGWWSRHYPKVSVGLAAVTVAYYLFGLSPSGPAHVRVIHTAVEYFQFIALIGSLFVVSGGIHINVKGEAKPSVNGLVLLFGALLANVVGTTGASMLLIRPWLRMNKYRITAHHVVFFVFIVSNVGGCLTPIGDPPLFLGYLKGVPFLWVAEHLWPLWLVAMGTLLAMFYVVDSINFRRAPKAVRDRETAHETWRFDGVQNVFFLLVILGAVFINHPRFLREGLMIAAAAGSYFTTAKSVHEANDFNFHPIKEVAVLFVGIFGCMIPALDWLSLNAAQLGSPTPAFFYFGSGALSSVLDNAPTYLSFLSVIQGLHADPEIARQVQALIQSGGVDLASIAGNHAEQVKASYQFLQTYSPGAVAGKSVSPEQVGMAILLANTKVNSLIVAISAGSVFFGANTYIGNGPNFMVKAIADHAKVRTPGFVAYIWKFTLPVMVPTLVLVWFIFFR